MNQGQLLINMKAVSVALKVFQPKINFLAKTIMKMHNSEHFFNLNLILDELSDISEEGNNDSQLKIQELINKGKSNDCQFALPWL